MSTCTQLSNFEQNRVPYNDKCYRVQPNIRNKYKVAAVKTAANPIGCKWQTRHGCKW